MTLILALALGTAGGLFRRALGGWLGIRRPFLVSGLAGASLALLWPSYGPAIAALGSGLIVLHWVLGHEWEDPAKLAVRYIPIPIVLALGFAMSGGEAGSIAVAMSGPAIVASYSLVQLPGPSRRLMRLHVKPIRMLSQKTDFIDGPIAVAEIAAGFWFFAFLAFAL